MGAIRYRGFAAVVLFVVSAVPTTGRAQIFVDFDDWTNTCPDTTAPGCDEVVVQPGALPADASLLMGTECFFGQCLGMRWADHNSGAFMGLVDPVSWSTVYFEVRVRLPPEGSEVRLTPGERIGLAKIEDAGAGLMYLVRLFSDGIAVERHNTISSTDVDTVEAYWATPSDWMRLAVLIYDVTSEQAGVQIWIDDEEGANEIVRHNAAGSAIPFGGFDLIFGIGQLSTSTLSARELYFDDFCFAPSATARDGFCAAQVAARLDAGVPDAGPDVGPDAAVADSASGSDGQTTYRGGGGCVCSPATGPHSPGAPLASLLALALIWRAGRRRR